MQVQLETLSSLERRMSIALPMSDIETQISERLKRVARKAKIPGFRPGKAPMKIVSANYGAGVREEILNEAARQGFYRALVEQKLRIAGYPRFEPTDGQDNAEQSQFDAFFEVYPEVTVGDLAEKSVEKPVLTVSDEEIDKTIDILRKQRTRFNYVERVAADGDCVIIDFKGTIDGDSFSGGSSENMPFVLGQGQMLAEFEAGVLGLKEGETKSVEVNFPENYHGKDVAGKKALFEITVKNVSEPTLPEVDEEFAKMLGIADGDVEKMCEEIRKNVEREVKRRLSAQTKENVMQALLDVTQIDLPKSLVNEEMQRLVEEMRQNLIQRGIQAKDMELPAETFRAQAERRVALGLILAELVSANKLEAKQERVREMIEEHADSYEQPSDVIEWYYADRTRLEGPTSMALEETVVEFVLSKAKIEEKSVAFDELMGANA